MAKRIGDQWPSILQQLGIAPEFLVNRHGPCPACGGSDRYRFDNKGGRGGFYCNKCGAGDGYALLMKVHHWDFRTARDRVMQAAQLTESTQGHAAPFRRDQAARVVAAAPTDRVRRLRAETCSLHYCPDAVSYLTSRGLWPATADSNLRAHPSLDYFEGSERKGKYPALIADIRDCAGELVSLHVTYLDKGAKLATGTARKILSPMIGRESCAVRLYAVSGDSMGIAEGIETAISAAEIHRVTVWSVLNTALMAKFTPPAGITRLMVFADRDIPGLTAGSALMERLQGQVRVEIRTPPSPHKDWNDALRGDA